MPVAGGQGEQQGNTRLGGSPLALALAPRAHASVPAISPLGFLPFPPPPFPLCLTTTRRPALAVAASLRRHHSHAQQRRYDAAAPRRARGSRSRVPPDRARPKPKHTRNAAQPEGHGANRAPAPPQRPRRARAPRTRPKPNRPPARQPHPAPAGGGRRGVC
jgi:hypothetical protein